MESSNIGEKKHEKGMNPLMADVLNPTGDNLPNNFEALDCFIVKNGINRAFDGNQHIMCGFSKSISYRILFVCPSPHPITFEHQTSTSHSHNRIMMLRAETLLQHRHHSSSNMLTPTLSRCIDIFWWDGGVCGAKPRSRYR